MKDNYPVVLKEKERALLESLANRGKGSARYFKRIMILLSVDAGKSYAEIESALSVSHTMIRNTRFKFHEEGLEAALTEKIRSGKPKTITPAIEAKITALACEEPPVGNSTWTIELLKTSLNDRFDEGVGWGSIQRVLANHKLKPWKKRCGASQN